MKEILVKKSWTGFQGLFVYLFVCLYIGLFIYWLSIGLFIIYLFMDGCVGSSFLCEGFL